MSQSQTNSQGRAKVWLKADQVHDMRAAAQGEQFQPYLRDRHETVVAALYDTGLRVGELVQVDLEMLDLDEGTLFLPTRIQKDYPTDRTPPPRTMVLGEDEATRDTITRLRSYLNNRWKDSPALFPSRQSDRMTTESVRQTVAAVAEAADVRPYKIDGTRGGPSDVTPHTLRHSVAYRMLHIEEGYSLYDVRNRLRHATIQTTEKEYDHFDRI